MIDIMKVKKMNETVMMKKEINNDGRDIKVEKKG